MINKYNQIHYNIKNIICLITDTPKEIWCEFLNSF